MQDFIKETTATKGQLDSISGKLGEYIKDKEMLTFAREFIDFLKTLFDEEGRYGLSFDEMNQAIEEKYDSFDLRLKFQQLEKAVDFLGDFLEDAKGGTFLKKKDCDQLLDDIKTLPPNFLQCFLDVWLYGNGYIRFTKAYKNGEDWIPAKIVVTQRDNNKIDLLRQAKKVVLMSATPLDYESIAELRGCTVADLRIIKKKNRKPENHTVRVIVNNKGIGSNQWSEKAKKRVSAIINEDLKDAKPHEVAVHGKKQILTDLGIAEQFTKYTHFWSGQDRGSNQFEKCDRQIIIGKPQQNIGAKTAIWSTLFKDACEFDHYYQRCIENDVLQLLGRLRALRKDNKVISTIIVKDLDTEFLEKRGFKVDRIDVLDGKFSQDAYDAKQYRLKTIKNDLVKSLYLLTELPTLETICKCLYGKVSSNLTKELSRDLKSLGLNLNIIKNVWKSLRVKCSKKSQNPIRDLIENCDFIPEWVKVATDSYFGWLESKQKIPKWELTEFDDILNDDFLATGWFLLFDPHSLMRKIDPNWGIT